MQVVDKTPAAMVLDLFTGIVTGDQLTGKQKMKVLFYLRDFEAKKVGNLLEITLKDGGQIVINENGDVTKF